MITVKLKSFSSGAIHEMAPMRAFLVIQKRPKIAKMTPDDLFSLTMVS